MALHDGTNGKFGQIGQAFPHEPQLLVPLSWVLQVVSRKPLQLVHPGTHAPHSPCEQVWVQGQVDGPQPYSMTQNPGGPDASDSGASPAPASCGASCSASLAAS